MTVDPRLSLDEQVIIRRPGRIAIITLGLGLLVLFVLRQFSQIDFYFSNLFFVETACAQIKEITRCGAFPIGLDPVWNTVREVGFHLPRLMMISVGVYLIFSLFFVSEKPLKQIQIPVVSLLTAALGPAIITNFILKEYWGRPRPLANTLFGGDLPYISPGDISSFCDTNCSFVSGEASAAFWMVTLVLFFKPTSRLPIGTGLVLLAIFIAGLRVAFGRHYFSDVVMSGFIVCFSFYLCVWFLQLNWTFEKLKLWLNFSNKHAFLQK